MEKPAKSSGCRMHSLSTVQAAFLSSIAKLFNDHGKMVSPLVVPAI